MQSLKWSRVSRYKNSFKPQFCSKQGWWFSVELMNGTDVVKIIEPFSTEFDVGHIGYHLLQRFRTATPLLDFSAKSDTLYLYPTYRGGVDNMDALEMLAIALPAAYFLFCIVLTIIDQGFKGALITLSEYAFYYLILLIIVFLICGWYAVALILAACAFLIYCRFASPR